MYKLKNIPFNNTFSRLPGETFSSVAPQGMENPVLVSANPLVCDLIGLDQEELTSNAFVQYFSGNQTLPGSSSLAMVYSGHQFGSYNPQLGDGRGLLLGEVDSSTTGKWDLHLKGAGPTPYSRFADGRAVLRSSIREYLCSEAMAGLGIPTTRALCVIGSDTPVLRETTETAATLLRVARSHIRFGHFEFFHYNKRPDIVKALADSLIEQHFPEIPEDQYRYKVLFSTIVERTAEMIAKWQTVGFAHGVMNTDNMSILGDTFDFGPFAFMDRFQPDLICNHSDYTGRYSFENQPSIGLWNLNALAHAFSSLVDKDGLTQALSCYEPTLTEHYKDILHRKLGLKGHRDDDKKLFSELFDTLKLGQADYTLFFRRLSSFKPFKTTVKTENETITKLFNNPQAIVHWLEKYRSRLEWEHSESNQRNEQMLATNPKYIFRNYLAQNAIEKANLEGDFTEVDRMLNILQSPFDEQPLNESYSQEPPEWGRELEISCSS